MKMIEFVKYKRTAEQRTSPAGPRPNTQRMKEYNQRRITSKIKENDSREE